MELDHGKKILFCAAVVQNFGGPACRLLRQDEACQTVSNLCHNKRTLLSLPVHFIFLFRTKEVVFLSFFLFFFFFLLDSTLTTSVDHPSNANPLLLEKLHNLILRLSEAKVSLSLSFSWSCLREHNKACAKSGPVPFFVHNPINPTPPPPPPCFFSHF